MLCHFNESLFSCHECCVHVAYYELFRAAKLQHIIIIPIAQLSFLIFPP